MTENRLADYSTAQEAFWAGDFGTAYIERNQGADLLASNLRFFTKALDSARDIRSSIEFGANIGMNLMALKLLKPGLELHAVEINKRAAEALAEVIPADNIKTMSILDFVPDRTWDLTLIKGVLIHINPDALPTAYDRLVASTSHYLLVAEYYNPEPVSICYRGHAERLFKRDFAGDIMERHPQMKLLDYGFAYRRDPNGPQDDITWFLMEKTVK